MYFLRNVRFKLSLTEEMNDTFLETRFVGGMVFQTGKRFFANGNHNKDTHAILGVLIS